MATQAWEEIKQAIDSATFVQLENIAKALNGGAAGFDTRKFKKRDLAIKVRAMAFDHAKATCEKAGEDWNQSNFRTPYYRGVLRTIESVIGQADSVSVNGEAAGESASAAGEYIDPDDSPETDESEASPDILKIAAMLAKLSGGSSVNAKQVRQIVRDELKAVPPMTIKVMAAGEVAGEVNGRQHAKFAHLLKAACARTTDGFAPNIWIAGPSGSGKTYAAKKVAEALGAEFHYNGALSMPHELLGFRDAAGTYHATPFRQAYACKSVYLFDEVDASENPVLLALNAALANGHATFPDGFVERHEDCRILAAANTWGMGATAEFVGRARIDSAFLNRFPVKISFDYDEELERAICGNPDWARTVQVARAKAASMGLKVTITPRDSMAGAALLAAGFSQDEAKELTFMASLTADQRKQLA